MGAKESKIIGNGLWGNVREGLTKEEDDRYSELYKKIGTSKSEKNIKKMEEELKILDDKIDLYNKNKMKKEQDYKKELEDFIDEYYPGEEGELMKKGYKKTLKGNLEKVLKNKNEEIKKWGSVYGAVYEKMINYQSRDVSDESYLRLIIKGYKELDDISKEKVFDKMIEVSNDFLDKLHKKIEEYRNKVEWRKKEENIYYRASFEYENKITNLMNTIKQQKEDYPKTKKAQLKADERIKVNEEELKELIIRRNNANEILDIEDTIDNIIYGIKKFNNIDDIMIVSNLLDKKGTLSMFGDEKNINDTKEYIKSLSKPKKTTKEDILKLINEIESSIIPRTDNKDIKKGTKMLKKIEKKLKQQQPEPEPKKETKKRVSKEDFQKLIDEIQSSIISKKPDENLIEQGNEILQNIEEKLIDKYNKKTSDNNKNLMNINYKINDLQNLLLSKEEEEKKITAYKYKHAEYENKELNKKHKLIKKEIISIKKQIRENKKQMKQIKKENKIITKTKPKEIPLKIHTPGRQGYLRAIMEQKGEKAFLKQLNYYRNESPYTKMDDKTYEDYLRMLEAYKESLSKKKLEKEQPKEKKPRGRPKKKVEPEPEPEPKIAISSGKNKVFPDDEPYQAKPDKLLSSTLLKNEPKKETKKRVSKEDFQNLIDEIQSSIIPKKLDNNLIEQGNELITSIGQKLKKKKPIKEDKVKSDEIKRIKEIFKIPTLTKEYFDSIEDDIDDLELENETPLIVYLYKLSDAMTILINVESSPLRIKKLNELYEKFINAIDGNIIEEDIMILSEKPKSNKQRMMIYKFINDTKEDAQKFNEENLKELINNVKLQWGLYYPPKFRYLLTKEIVENFNINFKELMKDTPLNVRKSFIFTMKDKEQKNNERYKLLMKCIPLIELLKIESELTDGFTFLNKDMMKSNRTFALVFQRKKRDNGEEYYIMNSCAKLNINTVVEKSDFNNIHISLLKSADNAGGAFAMFADLKDIIEDKKGRGEFITLPNIAYIDLDALTSYGTLTFYDKEKGLIKEITNNRTVTRLTDIFNAMKKNFTQRGSHTGYKNFKSLEERYKKIKNLEGENKKIEEQSLLKDMNDFWNNNIQLGTVKYYWILNTPLKDKVLKNKPEFVNLVRFAPKNIMEKQFELEGYGMPFFKKY